jgi:hypothetical protein
MALSEIEAQLSEALKTGDESRVTELIDMMENAAKQQNSGAEFRPV